MTGQVQAWRESCPLNGTCSECGLEFLWRDVVNPQFTFPRWCVEFGLGSAFVPRVIRTLGMMLRPWRFWRELQMHHRPRWGRIALFAILVAVPIWYIALAASAGIATWSAVRTSSTVVARTTPPWVDGIKATLAPWAQVTGTSFGPMPRTMVQNYRWQRLAVDGWESLRNSADYFGLRDGRDIVSGRAFDVLSALLVCPVGFALLPISRRVAKVRWRHVLRIATYGLLLGMLPVACDIYDQMYNIPISWTNEVSILMVIATGLLGAYWWAAATREYLRMPHAWVVGAYVVVFAYLFQWLVWQLIDAAIVFI